MSSNIRVQRICQHCKQEFTARTTVTKYCGNRCAKYAYKARHRKKNVEKSNAETKAIIEKPLTNLNIKAFLSIAEASKLLGVSRSTFNRMMKRGAVRFAKVGTRVIIRRADIESIFELPQRLEQEKKPKEYMIEDCYTISQVLDRFGVSDKALHEIIKRNEIPKIKKGRYAYVPKELIEKLLT